MLDDFRKAWQEQADFQRLLKLDGSKTPAELVAFVKEMVLHLHSETDELLRAAGAWKMHRNVEVKSNPRHTGEELADILKIWMVICQAFGFTPEQMLHHFWSKSMVVRQRHSEEWTQRIEGQTAILDIDGVICDYVAGFARWLYTTNRVSWRQYEQVCAQAYIDPKVIGLPQEDYERFKHEYRITDEHRKLPVMPHTRDFIAWVRNYTTARIVLLTARPIHDYPNLHADTLDWLRTRQIPFDALWWARDKGAELAARTREGSVLFAVDDERKYVEQYRELGIPVYWFRRYLPKALLHPEQGEINDLMDITESGIDFIGGDAHVQGLGTPAAREAHRGNPGE